MKSNIKEICKNIKPRHSSQQSIFLLEISSFSLKKKCYFCWCIIEFIIVIGK